MPYHVRITSKDSLRRQNDALALDKDAGWIEENIVVPRRAGRDIFVDGQVFSWESIDKILITQTDQPSRELIPLIKGRRRTDPGMALQIPDRWYVVSEGRDVTEQFITGAPGANVREPAGSASSFASDRRAVMVIYGHDADANTALFDWLRAIGLRPLEWTQLVRAAGSGSPYIGQILDRAFRDAQAVVALFTPDEWVLSRTADPTDPDAWRPQARPNVLIEAGMALVTHPTRTVIAVLGQQELPSDLAGRHYIRLSHADPAPLNDLARRLGDAGCLVDLSGTDWLRATRFPDRTRLKKSTGVAL
jgi:predicted nucleotide-binding protein